MKRIISLTIALCLVLGSFSFVFATATQWDTSDQANLRYIYQSVTSGGSLYTLVNNIYTRVNTISNTLTDIKSYLYQNNHSIAYWVEAINSWMQPIYSRLSDILTQSLNIEAVAGLLGSTDVVDGTTVRTPYLSYQSKGVAQWVSEIPDYFLLKSYPTYYKNNPNTQFPFSYYRYNQVNADYFTPANTPILGAFLWMMQGMGYSLSNGFDDMLHSYNQTLTITDPITLLQSSYTPGSAILGIYQLLSSIQNPTARLSYVLASDERIEAQEAAAANEEAVVDNFIDSSGSGSVGVSDFGSLSDASGAMKSNFETGQSAAGVFNVFDDSHFLYLSQSAADQLDTTGSNSQNRFLKSSGSDYDTPALDRYYEELNKILEVNKDD